jgi:argininosuccinate lyase
MSLWAGRFESGAESADQHFRRYNDSLRFDLRLLPQDVRGSIAWARALARAGVLTDAEVETVEAGLQDVLGRFIDSPADAIATGEEDVHSFVESQLVARIGDLGKKLHTGRSRNDQVATDLRLFCLEQCQGVISDLRALQRSLVDLGVREIETVIPGYTHLQRAQPVLFGHWCLAYVEMLERDAARFNDARRRMNLCPLGAGALAGTAFDIDRAAVARDLGFDGPTRNSLDTVSDRDFVLEMLAAATTAALHLSRWAEDLILYVSGEFAFITVGDAHATGSSMMPQKKNPDALELIRGKTGRIFGAHASLSMTIKGLPMAYNKDLQEDKEPLFDAIDTLRDSLQIASDLTPGLQLDASRSRRCAELGYANATDLADHLVEQGVPFRDAHAIVGRIVRLAMSRSVPIEELPINELRDIEPRIDPGIRDRISLEAVLARRATVGGTSPQQVRAALDDAASRLEGSVA